MQSSPFTRAIRIGMLSALAASACANDPPAIVAAPITASPPPAPPSASASSKPLLVDETDPPKKRPKTARRQPQPKDCCLGKNECKGQSGCATDAKASCSGHAHSCAGKNDCKGTGTSCPPPSNPNAP